MAVSPLFVKHSSLTPPSSGFIKGIDICYALEKVSGSDTVDGVQRIGGLYRIYLNNQKAREDLLINGLDFNGCNVSLLAHNPFSVSDTGKPTTKIVIGGVPLSVADSEIERVLLEQGVAMKSNLKLETYRDEEGKWTRFKTGRRFVYCEIPTLNIQPTIQIGLWRASIYYKEQIRPERPDAYSTQSDKQIDTSSTEQTASINTDVTTVPLTSPNKSNDSTTLPPSTQDSHLHDEARGGGTTTPVSPLKNQTSDVRKSRSKTRRSEQRKQGGMFETFFSRSSSKRSHSKSSSKNYSPNKYSRSLKGKQSTNSFHSPRVDLLG